MYFCLMYLLIGVSSALTIVLLFLLFRDMRRAKARDTDFKAWLADYQPSAFSPTDSDIHDI